MNELMTRLFIEQPGYTGSGNDIWVHWKIHVLLTWPSLIGQAMTIAPPFIHSLTSGHIDCISELTVGYKYNICIFFTYCFVVILHHETLSPWVRRAKVALLHNSAVQIMKANFARRVMEPLLFSRRVLNPLFFAPRCFGGMQPLSLHYVSIQDLEASGEGG